MNTNPVSTPTAANLLGMNLSLPMTRRDVLRVGLFSTAGMLLTDGQVRGATPAPPAVKAAAPARFKGKAKSVIQIFLWGGMSHIDTWDPKPDAGYDYMGEFKSAIPTNVAGIQLGELFPNLAKQADKYSLLRGMTHRNNGHETAAYLMQTAHAPGERLAYPSVGAVFALFKSPTYKGLIPPYVVLTQPQGRFSEEGFLGPRLKPFATGGDPNAARFEVEGVVSRGITDARQKARRELLTKMNTMGNTMAASPQLVASEEAKKQAYELILGEGKEVFDLSNEKSELRYRDGRHTFGQDCLAARRMVEAGVPYIVLNYPGGWDTHATTSQPCAGNARNWTRAWRCCCRICRTTVCWKAPSSGAAASLAGGRRWTGSRRGTADAIIMATSSPRSLPAAGSRAAMWLASPTSAPKK